MDTARGWKGAREFALAAVGLALLMAGSARARDLIEPERSSLLVQIDNDLFAGTAKDLDYTGGLAVKISGREADRGLLSVGPVLDRVDRELGLESRSYREAEPFPGPPAGRHARQFGIMAFTPEDIATAAPLPEERPYASLIFTGNGHTRVSSDGLGAVTSSLTVGVLGLPLVADLHEIIHDVVGTQAPLGYDHQISAGGEPTAKYSVARQRLAIAHPSGRLEVKTTLEGHVGYLTEAGAGVSLRYGRIASPWWGFSPELGTYLDNAAPVETAPRGVGEHYVFAGARLRVRAYNAFLQGQFRDSAVTVPSQKLSRVLAEAWIGVGVKLVDGLLATYTVRYHTPEIASGPASRDTIWASFELVQLF